MLGLDWCCPAEKDVIWNSTPPPSRTTRLLASLSVDGSDDASCELVSCVLVLVADMAPTTSYFAYQATSKKHVNFPFLYPLKSKVFLAPIAPIALFLLGGIEAGPVAVLLFAVILSAHH